MFQYNNNFYYYFFSISTSSFVLNFVCFREIIIARNRGHFEPANNYQRYIVLHSATIEYQEDSIWRRSRLDLQRTGSARGGSGIPIYSKKNRQNTPKYPKFLQIYPKIIEALNTLYLKFKESDILNTHI